MRVTGPNIWARHVALGLLIGAVALAGCAPMSFLITPVPSSRKLVEHEVQRDSIWAHHKIALIEVEGVITDAVKSSLLGAAGDNPVALFAEKLKKAADDDDVEAVVLRLNTPGGGVTASQIMHDELMRFRQRTGRPVIAAMRDVAASGGYYLACAADKIYAEPTTVTGSIGVIMIMPDISGTLAKIGAKANVIKSGAMKDAGSPLRPMRKAERAHFQHIIDRMYEQFVTVVDRGRPNLSAEQVRALADGRVFLAPDAKQAGLIDEIGSLPDAIEAAKHAAGLDDKSLVVVEYARSHAYRPNIYAKAPATPAQVNLIHLELPVWLRGDGPRFMYLWSPGW